MLYLRETGAIKLKFMVPIVAIILFASVAYAASVSIQTVNYSQYQGVLFNNYGNFTLTFVGFFVAHVTQPATSSCTWTSNGECHNAITIGHWVIVVTISNSTPIKGTFPKSNIPFVIQWNSTSTNNYVYTTICNIPFTISSSFAGTQTMTFTCDTGVSTFNTPTGIVITVGPLP